MLFQDDDLYCKVFVDAPVVQKALVQTIADIVGGTIDPDHVLGNIVNVNLVHFAVIRNEDHDKRRARSPGGFVFFRYYIEIYALPGQQRESFVRLVATLLEGLWAVGLQAVAACDFEDELPRKGGYNYSG